MPEQSQCARLCEIMGLDPKKVTGFTLMAYEGQPPTLFVQHIPPHDGMDATAWEAKLLEYMRAYRLEPIEDPGC